MRLSDTLFGRRDNGIADLAANFSVDGITSVGHTMLRPRHRR